MKPVIEVFKLYVTKVFGVALEIIVNKELTQIKVKVAFLDLWITIPYNLDRDFALRVFRYFNEWRY